MSRVSANLATFSIRKRVEICGLLSSEAKKMRWKKKKLKKNDTHSVLVISCAFRVLDSYNRINLKTVLINRIIKLLGSCYILYTQAHFSCGLMGDWDFSLVEGLNVIIIELKEIFLVKFFPFSQRTAF